MNSDEVNAAVRNPDTKYVWTMTFEPISSHDLTRLGEILQESGFYASHEQLSILTPGHPEHDCYDL